MTRSEQRSLLLLGLLAISGHLILGVRGASSAAPGAVTLFPSEQLGDPLAHRDLAIALAAPLKDGERIDVERATAAELQRLPGVGPALAKRIVADREKRGAFGGITGLDRVPGVGPAMLQKLTPHLSFGGKRADALGTLAESVFDPNTAGVAEWDALPGIGAQRAKIIVAFRDSAGPFRQLADLLAIPGIPARVIHGVAGKLRLP
jgi:competence ComEA-like helix-hairpin-helix protein